MRVAIIHDSLNDFRGAEVLVLCLANVLRGLGYKIGLMPGRKMAGRELKDFLLYS
jgi:hypothetical protein